MRLNLCRVGIPSNTQTLHKFLRDFQPIEIREGNFVRIEIACGAVKFAQNLNFLNLFDLAVNSKRKICKLFAHSRWSRTLAMSAAHHRNLSVFLSKCFKSRMQTLELWQHDVFHRMVQHKGIAQVVDVFTGAGEVQILLKCIHFLAMSCKLFLQEVLNSFHIMVCCPFDFLHFLSIFFTEFFKD
jgi:hypothetical protein